MTRQERRVLQRCLEEVYTGDQSIEADALADKLEDAGMVLRLAGDVPGRPPVASTRALPKRRTS